MAYNPSGFRLLSGSLSGGQGPNIWALDTVDAVATVNDANYVSDGVTKGALQGDIVWVRTRASLPSGAVSAINVCWVIAVGTGTKKQGIDLTDGLAVTATNTD